MRRSWLATAAALLLASAGCASTRPALRDAEQPVDVDTSPAKVITMPDGFPNVAFKCLGATGLYATTRVAANALTVLPDDPLCKKPG